MSRTSASSSEMRPALDRTLSLPWTLRTNASLKCEKSELLAGTTTNQTVRASQRSTPVTAVFRVRKKLRGLESERTDPHNARLPTLQELPHRLLPTQHHSALPSSLRHIKPRRVNLDAKEGDCPHAKSYEVQRRRAEGRRREEFGKGEGCRWIDWSSRCKHAGSSAFPSEFGEGKERKEEEEGTNGER